MNGRDGVRDRAFAAVYTRLDCIADRGWLGKARHRLLTGAYGSVLDIGAGAGANLSHYRRGTLVTATEPTPAMLRRLTVAAERGRVPVRVVSAEAEALPFDGGSFDTVVCTLVLCTIEEPVRALREVARVLRPHGRLLFLEHVRGDGARAWVQDRIQPLWSYVAAGCRPNRDTTAAIERAGLDLEEVLMVRPAGNFPVTNPVVLGSAMRRALAKD